MMPLEYTWGWMGMGLSGFLTKTTSGGSAGGKGIVSIGAAKKKKKKDTSR